LHPAIGSECKTRELLTEVLNHVVSLKYISAHLNEESNSTNCQKNYTHASEIKKLSHSLKQGKTSLVNTETPMIQYDANLRLSVHKHVNVKLFLDLNNLANFLLHGFGVLLFRDPETRFFMSNT
jgi:hypothetical protein